MAHVNRKQITDRSRTTEDPGCSTNLQAGLNLVHVNRKQITDGELKHIAADIFISIVSICVFGVLYYIIYIILICRPSFFIFASLLFWTLLTLLSLTR